MPLPVYVDSGTGFSTTFGSTNAVPCPSTVNAGDLLILHFCCWATTGAPSDPSGWTSIGVGSTTRAWYKVADGSEGGTTVSVGVADSAGRFARIYRFSGAATSGTIIEGFGADVSTGTTINDRNVTTSGNNRVAVNLVHIKDNLAIGDFTGMSGGTWADPSLGEYSTTTGNDGCIQIQTADMAASGTISGGSLTVSSATSPGTNDWEVIGFAIVGGAVPVGLASETDSAFSITPLLTPPGLHDDVNQALETDSAFSITASKSSPDVYLYTGFNFGGWEDLATRARSLSIRRGRPGDNLQRVEAGTAEGVWNGKDGYLDPSNTSSPWYGKILPLALVRIFRRSGGTTYERFAGPVERYLPDWSQPTNQDVVIQASDSFEPLANSLIESDRSTMTTVLSGANNDLTFTAVEGGGQGDNITVEYVVSGLSTPLGVETSDPFSGSNVIAVSEGIGQDGFGSITGGAFGGTGTIQSAVTVSGSDITVNVATNGAGAATSTAAQIKTALEAVPEVAALVSIAHAPGSSGAGVVTAMSKTNLTGGKWPEEYSGARINRILDLAGWDASAREIDSGLYLLAEKGYSIKENVSALQAIQDVADSELGYVFMRGNNNIVFHSGGHRSTAPESTASQATFSNVEGSGFTAEGLQLTLDKDAIVNDCTVTGGRVGAVPQNVQDTYSQTGTGTPPIGAPYVYPPGYGKRSLNRTTMLANDSDCLAQAQVIVDAYAYPVPRLTSLETFEPFDSTEASAWVAGVLPLDIGYRITVNVRPPGSVVLPTTGYVMFIEEIEDIWTEAQPMRIKFGLTSAAQSVSVPPAGGGDPLLNNIGGALILDDAINGKIGA